MTKGTKMDLGARVETLLGRKGVLVAVERVWLTVVFDDRPDWPQCFHSSDKWIHRVSEDPNVCTAHHCYWPRCQSIGCTRPSNIAGMDCETCPVPHSICSNPACQMCAGHDAPPK